MLIWYRYNVIHFVSISAKSSIYTVLGLNGTFVKAKIHTWDVLSPLYTHDGATANFALIETKQITV